MKNTYTNRLTVTVLLASFAFLSLPASARGYDDTQFHLQEVYKLQQQAKAAEAVKQVAVKAEECKKLTEQNKNANGS